MARKQPFIDGIFNYCDRWCERCPFTARCRVFAMEKSMRRLMARRDRQNAQFWAAMQNTLGDALSEVAEQEKTLAPQPDAESKPKSYREMLHPKERAMRNDPLALAALQYTRAVETWFRAHKENANDDSPLADPIAVIRWYQHFIYVKLLRALSGFPQYDEFADEDDEDEAGEQWKGEESLGMHDSNGSAKIAIIGIERSISAWSIMREHFPAEREKVMKIMMQLARLRALAERSFPQARAFHRPGFDDVAE